MAVLVLDFEGAVVRVGSLEEDAVEVVQVKPAGDSVECPVRLEVPEAVGRVDDQRVVLAFVFRAVEYVTPLADREDVHTGDKRSLNALCSREEVVFSSPLDSDEVFARVVVRLGACPGVGLDSEAALEGREFREVVVPRVGLAVFAPPECSLGFEGHVLAWVE